MKTSKKILSIFLAVLLLAGCMVTAFAASGTEGNITWNYNEETKTLTISGTGEMSNYLMIDPAWYDYEGETVRIVIEDGVTSIGDWAFYRFAALKSVTIPSSVTIIGEGAFANCRTLESVTIPTSVTKIDRLAFSDCTALTEVNFTGSEAQWNSMIFGTDALPEGVTVNYNYGQSQSDPGTTPTDPTPENVCPWCGGVHEGLIQGIIGFFHRILAAIFGARY